MRHLEPPFLIAPALVVAYIFANADFWHATAVTLTCAVSAVAVEFARHDRGAAARARHAVSMSTAAGKAMFGASPQGKSRNPMRPTYHPHAKRP